MTERTFSKADLLKLKEEYCLSNHCNVYCWFGYCKQCGLKDFLEYIR